MRAHLSILQKRFAYFLFSAIAIGSLASCQKENIDYPSIPAARLMAYNLAPDLPAVAFSVGTTPISDMLAYTGHTVNYVPVEAGSRQVGVLNLNNGTTVTSQTATFSDNLRYSAFLIGSKGNYQMVLAPDNAGAIARSTGNAWVRYINAVVDNPSGTADITISGQTEAAAFGALSEFMAVTPGTTTVEIRSIDNFETSKTISLEPNKLYTVMFVGVSGATDPLSAVQARVEVSGME